MRDKSHPQRLINDRVTISGKCQRLSGFGRNELVRPLSRCRRRSFVPPNATSDAITVRAVGFGSSALRGVIDAVRKHVLPASGKAASTAAVAPNDAEWQFF